MWSLSTVAAEPFPNQEEEVQEGQRHVPHPRSARSICQTIRALLAFDHTPAMWITANPYSREVCDLSSRDRDTEE